MSTFRTTVVSMALGLAFSGMANASLVCPTGACPPGSTLNAEVLDWTIGNVLVVPVDPIPPNVPVEVGDIFQTYAHARLATFNDGSGNPVGGLFGNQEWTYVIGFLETVASVTGDAATGSATFNSIAGGDNFFRIYYSSTAATLSSNLTGLGFADGTLVLEASVRPFDVNDPNKLGQTTFTASTPLDGTGAPIFSALDQFGANNYPAVQTISGQGGGRLGLNLISFNPAFFPGGLPPDIALDFDTQVNLAYDKTDPSACFWNGAGVVSGVGGQGTACVNTVGAINGIDGPNRVLMSDSSTTLAPAVPEPGTLALAGLGLAMMGMARRRRRTA